MRPDNKKLLSDLKKLRARLITIDEPLSCITVRDLGCLKTQVVCTGCALCEHCNFVGVESHADQILWVAEAIAIVENAVELVLDSHIGVSYHNFPKSIPNLLKK